MAPPLIPVPEPSIPIRTGGPPYPAYTSDAKKYGLSILDWFAGHALAGLMANTGLVTREYVDRIPDIGVSSLKQLQAAQTMEVKGAFEYVYHNITTPPPISGRYRIDNLDHALATKMWIHDLTQSSVNVSSFFNTVKAGWQIYLQKEDTTNIHRIYNITADALDSGNYTEFAISSVSGSGNPASLDKVTLIFLVPMPPPEPEPVRTEALSRAAYYNAAWMVQLRGEIPIDPEPIPSEEPETPLITGLPTGPAAEAAEQILKTAAEEPSLKTYVTIGSSQAPKEVS